MKIKVAPTTILAIQAALAIALCFWIGHVFHLERSYWAVMTALLLISQTWGESFKKAWERVLMTILGGVIGTLIFFCFSDYPYFIFTLMLAAIFCLVWCFGIYFRAAAFFITMFVVLIFTLFNKWSLFELEIRIYETMIGAVIAVMTSILVFPAHAKSNLLRLFKNYLQECDAILCLSFAISLQQSAKDISDKRDILYRMILQLNQSYQVSHYEMLVSSLTRKKSQTFITQFSYLAHYLTSLLEVSNLVDFSMMNEASKMQLTQIQSDLSASLQSISQHIDSGQPIFFSGTVNAHLHRLKNIFTQQLSTATQPLKFLNNFSFIYYLEKLNEILEVLDRSTKPALDKIVET